MKPFTTIAFLIAGGVLLAQTPQRQSDDNTARIAAGLIPVYRVTVTDRVAKAVNYQHRSGATKIDFEGTSLLPASHGEAKVESKQGYIEIEVEFRNLQPATKFGAEYLTYVLWAITPEGRTSNLGEILMNGTSSKLDVTTELQVFGLVVTAEPYFAVTRPSDLVVMENRVRRDTVGKVEEIDAKYELLKRGQYEHLANPLQLKLNSKMPLELYEARNAVQIARAIGAEQHAADTFQKAEASLKQAEAYQARKAGTKPTTMAARQTVQTAEDARAIAVQRQEELALASERQAGADREVRAENGRAAAESETERVRREAAGARLSAQAEADRVKRNNDAQTAEAQSEADRLRRANDLDRAAASVEADRLKQKNDAQTAEAQTEADRLRRANDLDRAAVSVEADRLKQKNDAQTAASQLEADRLRQENEQQRAAAQLNLDRVGREKQQLETEKAELRARLVIQFNTILETRDTARGLIVNLSDVLFDTAKFSLRPEAREKLAKVAGIILGHPGLQLDVEGHTDNVGSRECRVIRLPARASAKPNRWRRMIPPRAGSRTAG